MARVVRASGRVGGGMGAWGPGVKGKGKVSGARSVRVTVLQLWCAVMTVRWLCSGWAGGGCGWAGEETRGAGGEHGRGAPL